MSPIRVNVTVKVTYFRRQNFRLSSPALHFGALKMHDSTSKMKIIVRTKILKMFQKHGLNKALGTPCKSIISTGFSLTIIISGDDTYQFHLSLSCQIRLVHHFYSYVKILKSFRENMCKIQARFFSFVLGFCFLSFFFFFSFLGLLPWHMEVPRLGVESELQLPAYTIATAVQDPSRIYDLHHSSQQCQFPSHWARAGIEPESSWITVRFISTVPQRELHKLVLSEFNHRH